MMKYFYSTLFSLLLTTTIFAQVQQNSAVMPNSPNYYEVRENYLQKLKEEEIESGLFGVENEADDDLAKFMRWDYLMRTRVDAYGNYPDPGILFKEGARFMNKNQSGAGSRAATWEPIGNADRPDNGGGVGRVNVIQFDPDDPSVLYVGAAGGGLWKTVNDGIDWTPLTDNIPVTGIADIAINPLNTNTIYIATGDGYGYEATWQNDQDFWGGVYSAGILKSVDGGATWMPTGLSYLQETLEIVQRIVIHPAQPNILVAATRNGLFRTDNEGVTWTMVDNRHCYDIDINTANPDIMYASTDNDILTSTNAGLTWTVLESGLNAWGGRTSIETTKDNSNVIYFLGAAGFYKSDDAGASWDMKSYPSATFYGYYDMVMDVSNADEERIYTGGLYVSRSNTSGNSWQIKGSTFPWGGSDYVHADNHAMACHPTNPEIIYAGTDGGIFKTTDNGTTWDDLSNGLRIAQIYRVSSSQTDPDLLISGWQDNGTNLWNGTGWEEVDYSTWDGMEALIDHTDEDIMFLTHQYGDLFRSTNGGADWDEMDVAGGGWVTPFVMDPSNHLVLYYGKDNGDIQKTTNGGNTWTNKNANLGSTVFAIAVAPSNSNYVYACSLTELKVSTNGGDTWTSITGILPITGVGFNYIAVSNTDPQKVWIAISGYMAGNKVFYSDNAGASWTNISGSLPNLPVNTIVYENGSADRVYIGTDIGVFYKDNELSDWVSYMEGLPNVMVHELEINYTSDKLIAATYGRGAWQSDLAVNSFSYSATPYVNDTLCIGKNVAISYSTTGTFTITNALTVELSDAAGSFASPVVIGTVPAIAPTSGIVNCFIPETTPPGTGYRVRILASAPAYTGADNGFDIFIGCGVPSDLNTSVSLTSATLNWTGVTCAEEYILNYRNVIDAAFTTVTTAATTYTLDGLALGDYEWFVSTNCLAAPAVISENSTTEEFKISQTGIENQIGLENLTIYPNPFSVNATLQFSTLQENNYRIVLYDMTGREVRMIFDGTLQSGAHTFEIKNENLSRGAYNLMIYNGENSTGLNLILE